MSTGNGRGGPETDSIMRAVAAAPPVTPPTLRAGTNVGAYRLRHVIGEGGMGTVYLAERSDGAYRRDVAIKILRDGLVSADFVARFIDERQLLATLDHPGIVRLLDGGTTDDGRPYLVMEHIDGLPIVRHAATLPVRARVRLVVRVAEALQYAHQHLIVHRDVKPSNIVVDVNGAPKLLDFGIAKLVASDANRSARTGTGMTLFTPEYASPEQARGEPVTVATDVYGLGAVLYELLVGRPPQAAGTSPIETLANICEREPRRPEVDRDLDSIVLKALQKRPDVRYPSVAELAADLERYLAGGAVVAREATLPYRARKLVARHGGKLALGAAVSIALSATTVASIVQAHRVERRNRDLIRERGWQELAASHPDRALPYLVDAYRKGDDSVATRFMIAETIRPLSRELAKLELPGGLMSVAWSTDGERIAACGLGGLARLYDREGRHLADYQVDAASVYRCTFSRDGALLAAGDRDGRAYLWEVASGRLLHAMGGDHPVPHVDVMSGVQFSAAGDRLFTSGRDGFVHVWDVATGRSLLDIHAPEQILSLAVSADETRIATGLASGDVIVWDARNGSRLASLSGHHALVGDLRFTRDAARIFSASWDHTARIWDIATGRAIVLTGHRLDVYNLDLSPDERHLLTGSRDGTVKIWDATSGALEIELIGHDTSGSVGGYFDATGARVGTAGADGMFRVWDARTGVTEQMFPAIPGGGSAGHGQTGPVDIRFSPDGTRLVTASGSGATLWRLDRAPLIDAIETRGQLRAVALSADERRLAVIGYNAAEVWDLAHHVRLAKLATADAMLEDVGFSPDGARVVVAGSDQIAREYDASTGALVRALPGHTDVINRTSFSPDGTRILTASSDHTARIWDAATGALLGVLPHPDRVMSAAWSSDGRTIATACYDRRLRLWDPTTLRSVAEIDGGTTAFLDVTFSPDGRSLASSGHGGEVEVWNVATRTRTLSIAAHNAAVTTVTWSPNGELLASTADEPIARIWDAHTGKLLATRRHPQSVMQGVWNRAGTQLITAGFDGVARIWDVHALDREDGALARLLAQDPYHLVDDRLEPK